MRGKRFALGVLGAFVLAVAVPAQVEFGVAPDPLTVGGEATITYKDPSKPGQVILVEIENGNPLNPQYDHVMIQLNGNGEGSEDWTVPEWGVAYFLAPGAPPESCPIGPAPPPPSPDGPNRVLS
jgi:hypothetical protein